MKDTALSVTFSEVPLESCVCVHKVNKDRTSHLLAHLWRIDPKPLGVELGFTAIWLHVTAAHKYRSNEQCFLSVSCSQTNHIRSRFYLENHVTMRLWITEHTLTKIHTLRCETFQGHNSFPRIQKIVLHVLI